MFLLRNPLVESIHSIMTDSWAVPTKKIVVSADIPRFKRSSGFKYLSLALNAVVEKVRGTEVPTGVLDPKIVTREHSDVVAAPKLDLPAPKSEELSKSAAMPIIELLNDIDEITLATPPLGGPRRFGNMASRDWHDKLQGASRKMLRKYVATPPKMDEKDYPQFLDELEYYFVNSFGSKIRLDYGTGHELSFLAFIGALNRFQVLPFAEISAADLLTIFARYYDVVRRLIISYTLEPAGSHGAWGLDDHFHLIYILGAAQYTGAPAGSAPAVKLVLTAQTMETYKLSNLYVNAIAFIYRIKRGPFYEHSSFLYDIHTTVYLWEKVLKGLLKMYDDDVFSKFPVVQHFWFGGELYPWRDVDTDQELPTSEAEVMSDPLPHTLPGMINGGAGVRTTASNISITRTPWSKPPGR